MEVKNWENGIRNGAISVSENILKEAEAKITAKREKLEHYATRELTEFVQYDVFNLGVNGGDDIMRPDKDGDSLWITSTNELMTGGPSVRVLITVDSGTNEDVVIRQLEKIVESIKDSGIYRKEHGYVLESVELPF